MKENIHPAYHDITVSCSCGSTFVTRSTFDKNELHLEICSECHPFYTRRQKVVASGRIENFKKKYQRKSTPTPTVTEKTTAKPAVKKASSKKKRSES